jgi:protein phosphatase 1 regulatory subunit 37
MSAPKSTSVEISSLGASHNHNASKSAGEYEIVEDVKALSPPSPASPPVPTRPESATEEVAQESYIPSPIRKSRKPKKSILKPPRPPRQGFSFKRDILNPLNSRFSYDSGAAQLAPSATSFFRNAIGRLSATHVQSPLSEAGPEGSAAVKDALPSTPLQQPSVDPPPVPPKAPHAPPLTVAPLKSVRFTMSSLAVVYPIDTPSPPGKEAETRKRFVFSCAILEPLVLTATYSINSEYRALTLLRSNSKHWTGPDLLRLYDECCRTREELQLPRVRDAFKDEAPPKVLDLRNEPLTVGAALALSDVLSVDWNLKKLVLEGCGLDDEVGGSPVWR